MALSYLEKQKEKKPAEWSMNDESFLKVAIAICNRYSHKDIADWLKCFPERFNLQPKQEWSEEDETHLGWIIECFDSWKYQVPEFANQYQSAINWLKSLRHQPRWKPSDEQMRALADTLEDMPEHYKPKCTLETLERDLKKL